MAITYFVDDPNGYGDKNFSCPIERDNFIKEKIIPEIEEEVEKELWEDEIGIIKIGKAIIELTTKTMFYTNKLVIKDGKIVLVQGKPE